MSRVINSARVAPRTVTKVSEGAVKTPARPRAKRQARAITTKSITVDKRVMKAAKKITAEGKYKKLEIINEEEVIVR